MISTFGQTHLFSLYSSMSLPVFLSFSAGSRGHPEHQSPSLSSGHHEPMGPADGLPGGYRGHQNRTSQPAALPQRPPGCGGTGVPLQVAFNSLSSYLLFGSVDERSVLKVPPSPRTGQ